MKTGISKSGFLAKISAALKPLGWQKGLNVAPGFFIFKPQIDPSHCAAEQDPVGLIKASDQFETCQPTQIAFFLCVTPRGGDSGFVDIIQALAPGSIPPN
jgi:hypothetical protein